MLSDRFACLGSLLGASWEPLGALLGPPGGFLRASWKLLGGLLGPFGSFWELPRGLQGRLKALLARLTPSEVVSGISLGCLEALMGRYRALEIAWAVLGPPRGKLGGILGRLGAILEASGTAFGRRRPEHVRTRTCSKHQKEVLALGIFGPS